MSERQTDPDLERIRFLVLDVDGVLTDGGIVVDDDARESKHFDVYDGIAIRWWMQAGHRVAILSGRSCRAVDHRAAELGIDPVVQGSKDKVAHLEQMLQELELVMDDVCYIGDDLPDLGVMRRVGFAAAPANARPEVKKRVPFVTRASGGSGAVRELIEHLLRAQGRWQSIVDRHDV